MFSLFSKRPAGKRGNIALGDYHYLSGRINNELERVVEFYRSNPKAVRSNHLMVRLMQSVTVPFDDDVELYVAQVKSVTQGLARSIGFTATGNTGRVFKEVFYGKNSREILILTDNDFNRNSITLDWEDLTPIRVLRHDQTAINYRVPFGESESEQDNFAVVEINLPMLMLQYKLWRADPNSYDESAQRTVMQFLCLYPLANMVFSHVDFAFFNRIAATVVNKPLSDYRRQHSFYTIDYTDKVDSFITQFVRRITNSRTDFENVLLNTPGFYQPTLYDIVKLPKQARIRQFTWALIVARLPVMLYLMSLQQDSSNPTNGIFINTALRELSELARDNAIEYALPNDVQLKIHEELERFITLAI